MSSELTWRLCERHAIFNPSVPQLLVNPPADFTLLPHQYAWCIYAHRQAVTLASQTNRVTINAFFQSSELQIPHEQLEVILFLPKEKQLFQFLMKQLSSEVPVGTPLTVVGAKDAGIKSLARNPQEGWSPWQKGASGNHCQLLHASLEEKRAFNPEQAFSEHHKLYFLPGVFSFQRQDAGTQFLLEHLPQNMTGDMLDLGCGSGVIGQWLANHRTPTSLTLADLSTLAIASSQRTLAGQLVPTQFCLSDGFHQISQQFDWIISNPPFHQGKKNDYHITTTFIHEAKRHLKPGGQLIFVYNRFLPWQSIMESEFAKVKIVAENNHYAIAHAR